MPPSPHSPCGRTSRNIKDTFPHLATFAGKLCFRGNAVPRGTSQPSYPFPPPLPFGCLLVGAPRLLTRAAVSPCRRGSPGPAFFPAFVDRLLPFSVDAGWFSRCTAFGLGPHPAGRSGSPFLCVPFEGRNPRSWPGFFDLRSVHRFSPTSPPPRFKLDCFQHSFICGLDKTFRYNRSSFTFEKTFLWETPPESM